MAGAVRTQTSIRLHPDLHLLTLTQVIELTGFGRRTLVRQIQSGDLPAFRRFDARGSKWRVRRSDLEAWLERMEHDWRRRQGLDADA